MADARSLKTQQHTGTRGRPAGLGRRSRRPPPSPSPDGSGGLWTASMMLPRKEVIQPHLPVRLPCSDFTPVTGPTFDGSLPCGLGHRLRVLPTSVV